MKLRIGTSGWMYKDWNGRFYPKEVKAADQLPYFARHFSTVEINSTFYHLPLETSAQRWYDITPKNFVFAIKLNRYMTHTKRLLPDAASDEQLHEFMSRIRPLKEKLGVLLVQLPPGLRCDQARLEHLAKKVKQLSQELNLSFSTAIEFRHNSWFTADIFAQMRDLNLTNVIIDSPGRWPANTEVTADTAYIRFHGSTKLYRSSYSDAELKKWAKFIKTECAGCKEVYAYFNNDHDAVAIDNARSLIKVLANVQPR